MAASLSVYFDPSTKTLNWTISGLGAYFASANYIRAGICLSEVSSGQTSEPSIVHYVTAPAMSYSTEASGSFVMTGWDDARYTFYGFTQIALNGTYYPVSPVTVDAVAYWSWNTANGSATAEQTQLAYEAITGRGEISNFSYLVWNDLCKKVRAMVILSGTGWRVDCGANSSATPTYENTLMSGTNKTLTAAKFNAIRGNVGVSLSPVSAGDNVMGSYFVDIASALNNWISGLYN